MFRWPVFQNAASRQSWRCDQRLLAVMIRLAAILAVVALSVYPGTELFAESKSRAPVTSSIKGLEISPQELRIRVRALIRPTLGIIEERVDRAMADTSDPAIRRGLLVLKIEMTSTMLVAMLRSDPVLALADAWGYVLQVRNLLKRPEVRAKYGLSASMDQEPFALIEGQFRSLITGVQTGPSVEKLAAEVRTWADSHPIEGEIYRRPSLDSAVAKMLASSGDSGAFAAIGSIEETSADLMTRMDLYTLYLPRMARWEAELAADDLTRGVDARKLTDDIDRATRAADRIAAVAETASDLAARERAMVLDAIRSERRAVLDAVQKERIAVLREVEAMRMRLVKDADESLEKVVDHVFIRLAQLLLACAVLLVLARAVRGYLMRRQGW